jgi:hypothetical protein
MKTKPARCSSRLIQSNSSGGAMRSANRWSDMKRPSGPGCSGRNSLKSWTYSSHRLRRAGISAGGIGSRVTGTAPVYGGDAASAVAM